MDAWAARRARVLAERGNGNGFGMLLDIAARLWQTPRGSDGAKGGPNQRGSKGDLMLPSATAMWPTPQAHDAMTGKTPEQVAAMRERTGAGVSNLNEVAPLVVAMWATMTSRDWKDEACAAANVPTNGLLGRQAVRWQTPSVADATGGHANRSGERSGEMLLQGQARGLSSRLDPPISTDGQRSSPSAQTSPRRLNPRFAEWLMG